MVKRAWGRIFRALKPGVFEIHANRQRVEAILAGMAYELWAVLHGSLERMAYWSWDKAAHAMLDTLPKAYLRAAGQRRLQESEHEAIEREHLREMRVQSCRGGVQATKQSRAIHALGSVPDEWATDLASHRGSERRLLEEPGALAFGLYQPGFTDLAEPIREPAPSLTKQQERDYFFSLLFPPPPREEIHGILSRILPDTSWRGIGDGDQLQPITLADMVAGRYAAGENSRQIAQAIKPYFDGSSVRATRTARTLGAYIGTERNLAASNAIGDLIVAQQVHDAFGPNARPTHALRSGTVYHVHPRPDEYGQDVMPHPPIDTQRGPHDDMAAPRGVCYRCRCWLSPVLRHLPAMSTPAFTDNAAKLIPDTAVFSEWFARATPRQRVAAAGARRLAAVRDILQREPQWHDLVDHDTGKLLTIDRLKREQHHERMTRTANVQAVIARNRELTRRVAAFGSLA